MRKRIRLKDRDDNDIYVNPDHIAMAKPIKTEPDPDPETTIWLAWGEERTVLLDIDEIFRRIDALTP
jgi:hypothetical protein